MQEMKSDYILLNCAYEHMVFGIIQLSKIIEIDNPRKYGAQRLDKT